MKKIIVTVRDDRGTFRYDVELPTQLVVGELTDDLIQTLTGCDPTNVSFSPQDTVLRSERLRRNLDRGETLETAGVWNGDTIIMLRR